MPDYKNGKIYKIVNNENNKIYFGSTCQSLHKRMYDHRSKHSKCMSKKLGVDLKECQIILVEKFPCDCKYELEKRERYFIENFECVNKIIPTRTKKEYVKKNKEKIKKIQLEYREKNKEKLTEKKKEYYQKNKEKINERRKIKITCICGSILRKSDSCHHKKTKKHQKFICNPC